MLMLNEWCSMLLSFLGFNFVFLIWLVIRIVWFLGMFMCWVMVWMVRRVLVLLDRLECWRFFCNVNLLVFFGFMFCISVGMVIRLVRWFVCRCCFLVIRIYLLVGLGCRRRGWSSLLFLMDLVRLFSVCGVKGFLFLIMLWGLKLGMILILFKVMMLMFLCLFISCCRLRGEMVVLGGGNLWFIGCF